ncbi:MAG: class I tRNA ligase family protein, partial [Candidatus Taylorbacteria bacterium]|nr:class I tRNA ligase family protein [Candidatus Taylorbacteria bacterium]
NRDYELDLHRPFIDEIKFKCKCGGEMKRMPDVFDCWFESGSMPYAQNHYPFENLDIFDPKKDRGFPADFIAEGLDQTRGWFYSMIVLSVALFGESSYRNVIVNGIVLAEDGQKMSKRLKNYPDPMDVVNKYGADAIRYYMMSSPAVRAEDMRFAEKGVDEINKKLNMRLLNVCSFYELYADRQSRIGNSQSKHILDRWIISRLNQIIGEITAGMESYELDKASRPLMDFVDDLSVWYLRRSRERFKGDDENDKKAALETMNFVLLELSKLLAPFTPFLAEEVYQKAGGELESVHLEDWPVAGKVDQEVLTAMSFVRSFSTMALMQRNTLKINVRQPLKSLSIKHGAPAPKYWDEFKEILKDEVNVKEVILKGGVGQDAPMFELDPTMTPELIEEGQVRELLRKIQDMRKEKGLSVGDTANLMATVDLQELISKNEKLIKKTAGLVEIQYGDKFELL